MAKWVNSLVQDNGLNQIKTTATKMLLIKGYTLGDSYATVTNGTNVVASADMVSGDFTLAGAAGAPRTLTTPTAGTKSGTALVSTVNGVDDLHFAFTNGTDTVLWVTDETSNQSITTGNTVNFPQLVYTSNQPT
jgi:hypothetical protein